MNTPDIVVIVAALTAIAWINWYFFLSSPKGEEKGGGGEAQPPMASGADADKGAGR